MTVEGSSLRSLRKRAGLSQAALAARLGVAPNTVARWERGERAISEPIARLVILTLTPSTGKAPKKGD